ncbi:hypothetical protein [Mucilaginibacter sp. PPCGB 2223]|uniref:hypothetical protein n=1 Tax=Mucilaginibacter sp. PPCGB 2223 TaxID=1886027 RepID=UPI0011129CD5|nr:hypothetical protein [Mucilaginibacter sp. PPCGB 2223]
MSAIIKAALAQAKKFGVAFLSFVLSRPRIDIDMILNPSDLYGQKTISVSNKQDHDVPAVADVRWDFLFFWNYIISIRNNSSKTAYNLKIESIYKTKIDHLEQLNNILSLKEAESIDLSYIIRKEVTLNSREADEFRQPFPPFLDKIVIILSYTNEARKKFYTRFVMDANSKQNEHLFFKPH